MAMKLLPPGFRFHPTDVELLKYYLKRKILGRPLHFEAIREVDIYGFDPWELPRLSCLKTDDQKWYFFCPREKRYAHGARNKRSTKEGFWKTTGRDRPVKYNDDAVGMIKTLIFHEGRAPLGNRTDWVMHEYRLEDSDLTAKGISQDTYVLCAIFKKRGLGPNNGAQYGAPFREEDWEDDEISVVLPSDLVVAAKDSSQAPPPSCNVQPDDHSAMYHHEFNDNVPESVVVTGSPPPVFAASETVLPESSGPAGTSANAVISHADEPMIEDVSDDPRPDGMEVDVLLAKSNTSLNEKYNQGNQPAMSHDVSNDYLPSSISMRGLSPPNFAASQSIMPELSGPSFSANAVINRADDAVMEGAHNDPHFDGMDINDLLAAFISPEDNNIPDNQPAGADPGVGAAFGPTAVEGNDIFANLPDLSPRFAFGYDHAYNSHDYLELLDLRPDSPDAATPLWDFQGAEMNMAYVGNEANWDGAWRMDSCLYESPGKFDYSK